MHSGICEMGRLHTSHLQPREHSIGELSRGSETPSVFNMKLWVVIDVLACLQILTKRRNHVKASPLHNKWDGAEP